MNKPSLSKFFDCVSGLKILKYGAASAPVPATHCQPEQLLAKSASNNDMMQLHKDGYVSEELDPEMSSKLIIDIATALGSMIEIDLREDQIEKTCVLPVLRDEIVFVYPDPSLADLSYEDFRIHLQNNADVIAQKMINCI